MKRIRNGKIKTGRQSLQKYLYIAFIFKFQYIYIYIYKSLVPLHVDMHIHDDIKNLQKIKLMFQTWF